jgi:hypothetical protein
MAMAKGPDQIPLEPLQRVMSSPLDILCAGLVPR